MAIINQTESDYQEEKSQIVKKILNALCSAAKVKSIHRLADYINETPSRLYGWIRNGNIVDTGAILTKFPNINIEWLKTGEGPMFIINDEVRFSKAVPSNKQAQQPPEPGGKDINMKELVTKTIEVLESETVYKSALAANIRAFHNAVITENEMNDLTRKMAQMDEKMARIEASNELIEERSSRMEEMLIQLGASVPEKRENSSS